MQILDRSTQGVQHPPARTRRPRHRQQSLGHHEDRYGPMTLGAMRRALTRTPPLAEREFTGKLVGFDDYVSTSASMPAVLDTKSSETLTLSLPPKTWSWRR